MVSQKLTFIPHPDKVIVNITKASLDEMTNKRIKRDDGKYIDLCIAIEEKDGFDNKFSQNVSTGHVLAVGENVKGINVHDIVVLDYIVTNDCESLVGYFKGDKVVSLLAKTTYHETDANNFIGKRRAYKKGDYDELSKIIAIVKGSEIKSISPYIVLSNEKNVIQHVLPNGQIVPFEEEISSKTVLSRGDSRYNFGDRVVIKEDNVHFRVINNKELAVCFDRDILAKKQTK